MYPHFRLAFRRLVKSPGFSLLIVVTLALGIGVNVALFSIFSEVALRPLPVTDPERLILLDLEGPPGPGMAISDNRLSVFSYPFYEDLSEEREVLEGLLARMSADLSFSRRDVSYRVRSEVVSRNYFSVLGIAPHRGSFFGAAEEPEASGVVLGFPFWRDDLGSDETILGETVSINGHPVVVMGVAPPGFSGILLSDSSPDIYAPLTMRKQLLPRLFNDQGHPRRMRSLSLMGRLREDVTLAQAAAALRTRLRAILEAELAEYPTRIGDHEAFLNTRLILEPGSQGINQLRENLETSLLWMMGLALLVFFIACMNVAGLQLARMTRQAHEIVVRILLGAGRRALLAQFMSEGVIVAAGAGAAAALGSYWALEGLAARLSGVGLTSSLHSPALVADFILAACCGLLLGGYPAWRASRLQASELSEHRIADRGSFSSNGVRRVVVIGQMTLATLLVFGAGLFSKSLYNLNSIDVGFETDRLITFSVDPEFNNYTEAVGLAFYDRLYARLEQLPQIKSAGVGSVPVLSNATSTSNLTVEGFTPPDGEEARAARNRIGPRFFATLGVPLVEGREFEARDDTRGKPVAVVNQTFVDRYLQGRQPIGAHLGWGAGDTIETDVEVVGVVRDQKHTSLTEEPRPYVFTPYKQEGGLPALNFYLRVSGATAGLPEIVRQIVRDTDPRLPVQAVRSMTDVAAEQTRNERRIAFLSSAFASLALVLASLGLYGLLSFQITSRTREMGIRLALGASRGDVFRMVFRESLIYLLWGLVAGVPAALALGWFLESQLFGMEAADPATLALTVLVLTATALVATVIPARRATGVNPVEALRAE